MAKAPYLEMGVVVSFSEIFNRPATLEGARSILAQYNRESVLLVLAKLSAALRIWFRPDYEKDSGLAHDVFKHAARADAHTMPGRPRRLFFTRLGVLATARLPLRAAPTYFTMANATADFARTTDTTSAAANTCTIPPRNVPNADSTPSRFPPPRLRART